MGATALCLEETIKGRKIMHGTSDYKLHDALSILVTQTQEQSMKSKASV